MTNAVIGTILPIDFDWYSYVILPALIFFARIVDVSIGTIRIIVVSRGNKYLAPILGFFEVLIWILAIGEIMQNLNNWVCYIAYAAGFASGNLIGMMIEEKLAMGTLVIRVITQNNTTDLVNSLYAQGYGVTEIDAKGKFSKVNVIYIILKRKRLQEAQQIIQNSNPTAFYTVEDLRKVQYGVFPINQPKNYKRRILKLKRK
ncbi:MAG: hypothetical protein C0599_09125 [Salinivirgaceae bacterium]|nr:MAG: hypothetical protein C0599_09125 [Salinivirgaceae bacterium]